MAQPQLAALTLRYVSMARVRGLMLALSKIPSANGWPGPERIPNEHFEPPNTQMKACAQTRTALPELVLP
jgi:hypothetical protein